MQYFIYSVVIFLSTLLGAFVGLGGGVIIKPMLDALHMHTLSEISFFSSCAVFAMSVTSTAKYLKKGVSFEKRILLPLSAGGSARRFSRKPRFFSRFAVRAVGGCGERRAVRHTVRIAFLRAHFCQCPYQNGEASKSNRDSVRGLTARRLGGVFGYRRRTDQCCRADSAVLLLRKGCGSVFRCGYLFLPAFQSGHTASARRSAKLRFKNAFGGDSLCGGRRLTRRGFEPQMQ